MKPPIGFAASVNTDYVSTLGKLQRHGVSPAAAIKQRRFGVLLQVNTCCKRRASLSVSALRRVGAHDVPGDSVHWRIVRGTVVLGERRRTTAIGSSRKRCNAYPEKPAA